MSGGTRSILLRITGDPEQAKAAIDEVIAKVQEVNKQKGDVRIQMLGVERAKTDLDDIILKLKAMPKSEHIRIQVTADQAKLDKLMAQMALLRAEMAKDPAGGSNAQLIRMGNLSKGIETATADLTKMERASRSAAENMVRDFGKSLTSLKGIGNDLAHVRQGLIGLVSDVISKVPLVGGLFAKIADGFGTLVTGLIPEAATGVGGLVAQFVALGVAGPILLVIAAAMASLVVTIGMALAGIVALGVAFLVALGPIILLLGAVAIKVKNIISSQQTLKTAAMNLKAAYDSQKQAVLQLHQAEQQQALQRIAALADQKTATLALTDAENAQRDALLGVQSAKLGAQQSRLDLARFNQQFAAFGMKPGDLTKRAANVDVTTGGQKQVGADKLGYEQLLLQYKQAVLAIKVADQGVHDATAAAADSANTLALAHALVARYLTMGLKAYPAYLAATNATAVALGNLARANDQVASGLLAQRQALLHGKTEAAGFLTVWRDLKKTLSVIFGPAEKAVFAGLERALLILAGHGKSLTPAFTILGKAIGGAFVKFAQWMTSKNTMADLKKIIIDAAHLTTVLAGVFNKVFTIVNKIAVAVLPSMVSWIKNAGTTLESVVKHPKAIAAFLHTALNDLRQFGSVISGFLGFMAKLAGYWKNIKDAVLTLKNFLDPAGQGSPKSAQGQAVRAGIPASQTGLNPTGTSHGPVATFIHDFKSLFGLAAGGVVTGPGAYMIGEGGAPEAVLPLAGAGGQMVANLVADGIIRRLGGLAGGSRHATMAGRPSPATAGGVHHHNWHLNQGNTIQSDEHFAAVIERRLAAEGIGYK